MATDKSIQNQKVFVKLESVLALQRRYERTIRGEKQATPEAEAVWRGRREAFEEAIAVLELPITKEDHSHA